MKKKLCTFLAMAIVMGSLAACSGNTGNTGNDGNTGSSSTSAPSPAVTEGKDSNSKASEGTKGIDPASVKGKVVVSIPNWGGDLQNDMKREGLDKLNELYPNVELVMDNWAGGEGLGKFLTVKASAGALPDVVMGWDSLGFFHTQNWIAPLNDLLETDAEAQYIPESALDAFSLKGKAYALPTSVVFNAVIVNLDMLETINEDIPSYNWTIDEFMRLAKKATTDELSGITNSKLIANLLSTASDPVLCIDQFNPETFKFDFTNGSWEKGIKYVAELKAVKGLFGDELKNQFLRDSGKADDYEKKFGKDANAMGESKILMHFEGTWEKGGWHKHLPFNWDYYPIPQDPAVGYKNPAGFNYVFMTPVVKAENKQAAYEVAKFLGHGSYGNIVRLQNAYDRPDEATGTHAPNFVPASLHPDVIAKLKESKTIKPGEMFMYENMANSVRGDVSKGTVDIGSIINPLLDPIRDDLQTGKLAPASVAADIEAKVNAEFEKAFNEVLSSLK